MADIDRMADQPVRVEPVYYSNGRVGYRLGDYEFGRILKAMKSLSQIKKEK